MKGDIRHLLLFFTREPFLPVILLMRTIMHPRPFRVLAYRSGLGTAWSSLVTTVRSSCVW